MTSTTTVPTIARTVDTRPLPGPSDDEAWTDELVAEIACGIARSQSEPISRDELIATYDTADPEVLRARFALADDVAAAERYAAADRQVAA